MLQSPFAGLAQVGRMLLSRYNGPTLPQKRKVHIMQFPPNKRMTFKPPVMANPFQTLSRGLSSTLSQLSKRFTKEDINAVVKGFMPADASFVKPQYPLKVRQIQFADLDGDLKNELITSYKTGSDIKTMVLKKQDGSWYKAAEISSPGHENINYRGIVDLSGEGKKHLLIGSAPKGSVPVLRGYKFENNSVSEMFARDYHRLEVVGRRNNQRSSSKPQLAIWKENESSTYDIELLNWSGKQLEKAENTTAYQQRKVVPYYVREVKKSPYSPSGWYNLADTLTKAGLTRDALIAVDVGMSLDRDPAYKDKFLSLKNKLKGE